MFIITQCVYWMLKRKGLSSHSVFTECLSIKVNHHTVCVLDALV